MIVWYLLVVVIIHLNFYLSLLLKFIIDALIVEGFSHSWCFNTTATIQTTSRGLILRDETSWLLQDINWIEKVGQRFFTRAICNRAYLFLHGLWYSMSQYLEYRRVLAVCYKIVFKFVDVDASDFFSSNTLEKGTI